MVPSGSCEAEALKFTVTDDDGASDSTMTTLTLGGNQAPTADFTATPTSGEAPLIVNFDATASQDAEGMIDTYAWDYGDGTTGSGMIASHDYTAAGVYTATLTVTDTVGAAASTSATITVIVNEPPTANLTAIPDTGAAPLTVDFDATASQDPDGTIVSYDWDFGDGEAGLGVTASHVYIADGMYTVALTVTDDLSAIATATTTVTVVTIGPVSSIDARVAGPSDDAEEKRSSGSMNLSSSDLELVDEGSNGQIVGMRFRNISIQPATITAMEFPLVQPALFTIS